MDDVLVDSSDIAILRDKLLGTGAFAEVFEGRLRSKQGEDDIVAVKVLRNRADDERQVFAQQQTQSLHLAA